MARRRGQQEAEAAETCGPLLPRRRPLWRGGVCRRCGGAILPGEEGYRQCQEVWAGSGRGRKRIAAGIYCDRCGQTARRLLGVPVGDVQPPSGPTLPDWAFD